MLRGFAALKNSGPKLSVDDAVLIRALGRGIDAAPLSFKEINKLYPHISNALIRKLTYKNTYRGKRIVKQRETIFKEKVQHRLRQMKGVWFVKIAQKSIVGTPDILCCVNGVFVAIELKSRSDSRRHPKQKEQLRNIQLTGGVSFIIHPDNYTDSFEKIKEIAAAS